MGDTTCRTTYDLQIERVSSCPSEVVETLLASYAFPPYRTWRRFGRKIPLQLIRHDLVQALSSHTPEIFLASQEGAPVGLACVVPNTWESEQLGIPSVELRYVLSIGTPATRQAVARALVDAVRTSAKSRAAYIVHRVDCADYATIGALEATGFCLVDTAVTFIGGPEILPLITQFHRPSTVRPYVPDDWPAIEAITHDLHSWGRLYNDPRIAAEQADRLYLAWVRQCCERIFADETIVALRDGRIVGFLSYQFQRALYEVAGVRVMGRGLLGVARGHKGAALGLISGAVLRDPRGADFIQFDTHLAHHELMGLYGKLLQMDMCQLRHVFHGWLDPTPTVVERDDM